MLQITATNLPTLEHRAWQRWFVGTDTFFERWVEWTHTDDGGDDPFAYNETASVSFLCNGAGRADLVAIADYAAEKDHTANGRCDLYLADDDRHWMMEFKQLLPTRENGTLDGKWKAAVECAQKLRPTTDETSVAGVIVSLYYLPIDNRATMRATVERFAADNLRRGILAHFTSGHRAEAYVLLDVCGR